MKTMKSNDELEVLKIIIKNNLPSKRIIVALCACFFVSTGFSFCRPLIIKVITDKGMVEKNIRIIFIYASLLLFLAIAEQIMEVAQSNLFISFQNKVRLNLYERVFQKLLRIKLAFFMKNNNAEVINQVETDVENISMIADRSVLFLFHHIFRILSGIFGLFLINWKLAVLVIAIVPIKLINVKYLAKCKTRTVQKLIEENSKFTAWFGDQINGVREIKLWNMYEEKKNAFIEKQSNVLKIRKKNVLIDTYNLAGESIIEWGLTSLLYAIGGFLICKGDLTIGSILAFLTYSVYVTGPISAIFDMSFIFAIIVPSARRLFDFMKLEEEEKKDVLKEDAITFSDSICFKHVAFSYENENILRNINFEIKKGEKIGIIGTNGSGKTTLINLLLRFQNPKGGLIELDKNNICSYNLNEYRNLFSVVSQEVYLFQDTIQNNINLLNGATQSELDYASRVSNLDEYIRSIPEGYQSGVGTNGSNLSGGQRQKIAVARAIIKDASIIILDEATSNLDKKSRQHLQEMIFQEFEGKTIIIITHSVQELENMDRLYKLQDGGLTEVNFSEL